MTKSENEWREQLTHEQFYVTRQHGTEPAFSGPYWNEKASGLYACVCCGEPLFSSDTKFKSGTGWPSYYAPVSGEAISKYSERSFFMRRTEVRCATCDAHLGHVFRDGPRPTGFLGGGARQLCFSRWARNASTDANFTVPLGSSASIEPSA